MRDAVWAMLNKSEKGLLRDSEPSALKDLDEDGLLALHARVRRARNKYTKLYRRRAADQVDTDATRERAHATHARTAAKAEAFEDALARVSRSLTRMAKASAAQLKAERLATARKPGGKPRRPAPTAGTGTPDGARQAPAKRKKDTPIGKKARASSRAANRRTEVRKGR